jgi:hypothetical protein
MKGAFDFEQHIPGTLGVPRAGFARLGVDSSLVLKYIAPDGTVYDIASKNQLNAHINETNPFEHTAGKIQTTLSNVQNDLDSLDELKADNSAVESSLRAVSSSTTTVNVNTSVTESNLLSFTLAGGVLGRDGDMLIIEAAGDILANSGAPTWIWKLKSGTVIMDSQATAMAINANLRRWKLVATILRTTVGSQILSASLLISLPTATTEFNAIDPLHTFVGNFTDFTSTDFNGNMTVAFTVQMSVSNANNRTRMYGYNARKVRAV